MVPIGFSLARPSRGSRSRSRAASRLATEGVGYVAPVYAGDYYGGYGGPVYYGGGYCGGGYYGGYGWRHGLYYRGYGHGGYYRRGAYGGHWRR
jgi:hypothetical protein